jgi:hypothetical protein
MSVSTPSTAPKKGTTATKRTPAIRKATPPRAARKTTAKRPAEGAGSRGGKLNGTTTRHGKIADEVWGPLEAKAATEGRGPWEVLRQLAAEYVAGRHDRCSPNT